MSIYYSSMYVVVLPAAIWRIYSNYIGGREARRAIAASAGGGARCHPDCVTADGRGGGGGDTASVLHGIRAAGFLILPRYFCWRIKDTF